MEMITLSEDQFYISIGMSEAEIASISYEENILTIIAKNVDLLCDFSNIEFYSPQITYDEWLNNKYFSNTFNEDDFDHISFFDAVKFVIHNPKIYYEGSLDQFIFTLGEFDFDEIDSRPYSYTFGGSLKDSNHDEFEICSNQLIEFYYNKHELQRVIQNKRFRTTLESTDFSDRNHINQEREQMKLKLSKNSTQKQNFELQY